MQRRAFLTTAALGTAWAGSATPVRAADPIPLAVGVIPSDSAADVLYALDGGYFTSAGLDVKVTAMNSGPTIEAAVAAGALDVGVTNVGSLAAAREHGVGLRFIAPAAVYGGNVTAALMVLKGAPIRSGADLAGKVVAVNGLRDLTQFISANWIERNGGDPAKAQFVEIPFPQMAAALQAGRVAAALIIEPFLTASKAVAQVLGSPYEAIGRVMLTGWFATDAWLQRHADVALRFVTARRAAALWANSHHRESGLILARYTKIDPAVLDQITRAEYGLALDPVVMQPLIALAARYGTIAKPVAASELIWTPPA